MKTQGRGTDNGNDYQKCLPTYDVLRKIGEGVYGSVFHVRDNLKERAVKVVPIIVERSLSFRTQQNWIPKYPMIFTRFRSITAKSRGRGSLKFMISISWTSRCPSTKPRHT